MTRSGCLTITGSSATLWALIIGATVLLTGCGRAPIESENAGPDGRTVELMATAPDGTNLWRYDPGGAGRWVYFASSGTQQTVSCGKNCSRAEIVPTAD